MKTSTINITIFTVMVIMIVLYSFVDGLAWGRPIGESNCYYGSYLTKYNPAYRFGCELLK